MSTHLNSNLKNSIARQWSSQHQSVFDIKKPSTLYVPCHCINFFQQLIKSQQIFISGTYNALEIYEYFFILLLNWKPSFYLYIKQTMIYKFHFSPKIMTHESLIMLSHTHYQDANNRLSTFLVKFLLVLPKQGQWLFCSFFFNYSILFYFCMFPCLENLLCRFGL